ncbi:hypothetical protein PROFUN_16643 [Planoprotostelium fungivorum]|uniref:glucan endo-1,3-beta-D-glucosidase n=1 Tax=Planoprotostelium fungivorum TaxID=1890364 RepID=A0A2P6MPY1_9EUKA|nr:hypothetical protein PROFUN_16643 [Planoprotostelium fungivorum]
MEKEGSDSWRSLAYALQQHTRTQIVGAQIMGIDYAPRRGVKGECPTEAQVFQDLSLLKPYTQTVRIYNMNDCNHGNWTLKAAKTLGMKVFVGVMNDPLDMMRLDMELLLWADLHYGVNDIIVGCTVGVESVFREDLTAQETAARVGSFKTWARDNGFTFPVGYADATNVIQKNPVLATTADILLINIFPFWEGTTMTNKDDMGMVNQIVGRWRGTQNMFPNVKVIVGETGWSSYDTRSGQTGLTLSKWYLELLGCAAYREGMPVYWFEAFDQPSRGATASNGPQEGQWGMFNDDRTLKYSLNDWKCTTGVPSTYTTPLATRQPSGTIWNNCHTMYTSAQCQTISEDQFSIDTNKTIAAIQYLCGLYPNDCTAITDNGNYGNCNAAQKATYMMNIFYQKNSANGAAACSFDGIGKLKVDAATLTACHNMFTSAVCHTSSEDESQVDATKVANTVQYVCSNYPDLCKELNTGGKYAQCNTVQRATYAMDGFYAQFYATQGDPACSFDGIGRLTKPTYTTSSSTSSSAAPTTSSTIPSSSSSSQLSTSSVVPITSSKTTSSQTPSSTLESSSQSTETLNNGPAATIDRTQQGAGVTLSPAIIVAAASVLLALF